MSIVKKKKPSSQPTTLSKRDIQFEKIIQISGIIFLLACLAVLGFIILLDLLNIIETTVTLNAATYSFIIFTGTSSGLTLGMGTVIKNNREQKRRYFFDWVIGEFFLCIMAIFAVGIYQW